MPWTRHALSAAAALGLPFVPALAGPIVVPNGPAPEQVAELTLPPAAPAGGTLPVVILLHGGCYRSGPTRDAHTQAFFGAVAARGAAAWSVHYRGINTPGGGYPGRPRLPGHSGPHRAAASPALIRAVPKDHPHA